MQLWSCAWSPESRRLALVRPRTHLPPASPGPPAALEPGFATAATTVVVPTPTALTHHAHAHDPPTPTTTPATPGNRHPQLRACVHTLGCKTIYQAQLSQHQSLEEAPAPARARPSTPASEGTQPPSPIDELRPLEPPQLPVSLSSGGVEGDDSILSPQRGREARDAIPSARVEHHEHNGPCSRTRTIEACQGGSPPPGLPA